MKRGWTLPNQLVAAAIAGHSALGLLLAALLYLICLTGALLMWERELTVWEQPVVPEASTVQPAQAAAFVLALRDKAVAELGGATDLYVELPRQDQPRLWGNVDGPQGEFTVHGDPATGAVLSERVRPVADFLAELHIQLHVPDPWGELVVGIAGVALLALLISGVLAHPRIFRDAFTLRWGGQRRVQETDLHNRMSVWGLPFHLLVTLSGVWLALIVPLLAVTSALVYGGDFRKAADQVEPNPPPLTGAALQPAPAPALAELFSALQREAPGAVPQALTWNNPGVAGQTFTLHAHVPGELAREDEFQFDGSGAFTGRAGYSNGAVGLQIVGAIAQLHFGLFGGWPMRWLYGLLGLALTAIVTTGVNIWLARRRDRGDPAGRWEQAWVGVVWGQPLAFAAALLASQVAQVPPLVAWALVSAVSLGAALAAPSAVRASKVLRLALAGVLLACISWHLATFGLDGSTWALVLSGLLAATAGLLGLSACLNWLRSHRAFGA